jgi:hypothetical protein
VAIVAAIAVVVAFRTPGSDSNPTSSPRQAPCGVQRPSNTVVAPPVISTG